MIIVYDKKNFVLSILMIIIIISHYKQNYMTAIIYFRETIRSNIRQLKYYIVPTLLKLY